jgi:type II secretory pathway pseudopilin PulG
MRLTTPARGVSAFTMVEIAISLGVIAIALVAILGVLPTGVRVQRDNREDTILNQEGVFWVEAIRSGSKGLDYLTNYVDTITISNRVGSTNFYNPVGTVTPSGTGTKLLILTNGQTIIGLLTFPKVTFDASKNLLTNRVTARVRAITGSAVEKSKSARDMAFAYQIVSEVVPLNVTPPEFLSTNGLSGQPLLARLNLNRLEINRIGNFEELRLTLQGPVISRGTGYHVLGTPKSFRTLIGGTLVPAPVGDLVQPAIFVQQQLP